MNYRVIVTPEAEADLRTAYRYIREDSPEAAREWAKGLRSKIRSLSRNPERAALAPESSFFHEPIRELLYGRGNRGTYRILFVVTAGAVFILHVRHGSRRTMEP